MSTSASSSTSAGSSARPPPAPRRLPPAERPTILANAAVALFVASWVVIVPGIALGPCSRDIEVLEGPGEPAVVVEVETRRVEAQKQTFTFVDLQAEDGTLWTHKGDRDLAGVVRPGHRTTMHRGVGEPQGAHHPGAILAEERDERLRDETLGRAVALFGVTPFLALIVIALVRRNLRRLRVWTHGEVARGTILELPRGPPDRVSYRFCTGSGGAIDGSALASRAQLERLGVTLRPGMTAWVLYAPEAPHRNVLHAAEDRASDGG